MAQTDGSPTVADASKERLDRRVLLTVLSCVIVFTSSMTIVSASLPTMADDLDSTESLLSWAVTGLFLVMSVSTPVMGRIGDGRGHRRVFLAGTAGSLCGALLWYGVGCWLGRERLRRFAARHGRWLTLGPAEVDRAGAWFAQRGGVTVLVGRVIPGVRSLISVPAGVAGMPLTPFLAYSALGTVVWTGLLTGAGYGLGENYRLVGRFVEPIGNGVLILAMLLYLYRVATFERGSDARG